MIKSIDGLMLKDGFKAAYTMLDSCKETVNALNVFPVPDGDTGTNMSLTMKSALASVMEVNENSVAKIAKAASSGSLMGARGNSGVILSQLLRGFSIGMEKHDTADIETFNDALTNATKVAYNAVMKPTEGTILTVSRMMSEYSAKHKDEYDDLISYMKAVIAEGYRALELTPTMLSALRDAGVVDAGGKGYLLILDGILKGIIGEEVDYTPNLENFSTFADRAHTESSELEFGYCTEFMIKSGLDNVEQLRGELSAYGDSLLVVSDSNLTKVHIHTNSPGAVLERAIEIGQICDIKIDNMRLQSEAIRAGENEAVSTSETPLKYAFIAVSAGAGIVQVFKDLGVHKIISGGQTMNPSTEDFVAAIEAINADTIYILPNNKNIVMAAEQAKQLSKKDIQVIKTLSIPQGFSALLAFDENAGTVTNLKRMNEAISEVKSLQVTYSVRDSEFNGIKMKKGDIIGMIDGKIVISGTEIEETVIGLIERSVGPDDSLITIFYGSEIDKESADRLMERLSSMHDSFDIELVKGDQPIYYYIISIE